MPATELAAVLEFAAPNSGYACVPSNFDELLKRASIDTTSGRMLLVISDP